MELKHSSVDFIVRRLPLEIFSYDFMRNAFLMTILLSVSCACIGHVIVLRGLSLTGDALSHSALAGVSLGLIVGLSPSVTSVILAIIVALFIEALRRAFPRQSDLAISIVMSAGIGLGAVLASKVPGINLQSYLFGSLVAIQRAELHFVLFLTVMVLLIYLLMYRELFHLSFDPHNAKLLGIRVNLSSGLFMVLTGLTIAVAARSAGILIVSSLMVLPFATSIQHRLSYKGTLIVAMAYGVWNSVIGLFAAYYLNLATGGSIVIVSIITLAIVSVVTRLVRRV